MAIEILDIPANPYIYQTFGSDTDNIPFTQPTEQPLSGSGNIEFYIFDLNNNILSENYNFTDYSILNEGQLPLTGVISSIYVDLEKQITESELLDGEYITYFNFFTPKIGSFDNNLVIKEISGDRKELRFVSPLGENDRVLDFIEERASSSLNNNFPYFYLNFGENKQIIGVNLISNEDGNFIKLYQSLPEEFDINSNFWVVTPITDPVAYNVKLESESFIFDETVSIKGPNFNLNTKDQVNNSTSNLSYQDLIQTTLTSSYDQIENLLQKTELNINTDYSNFSNFAHFSSVKTRLENFFYKISLIEEYSSSINVLNSTNSPEVSSSKAIYESKINSIINSFDGYDYFLYYDSSSYSWPKTTSTKPYLLAKSNSTEVETWLGATNPDSPLYGGIILSASLYDEKNPNSLYYSIPEYLRNDSNNAQYELFVDMVAQHFDNIWIYYRDVSKKYDADNRLNYGVSKDLVADVIRDFGIKLYQNNFSNNDLYTAFLGLTPNGGLFPFPNITGSLPTPTGFEYIDQFISASNDSIPLDDINKSLYKRIYHNLPYLLKSKGTIPGLKALITSYGIPDTILRINEFGGKDKINVNDWDHWQREFNYAFKTNGNNFISSSWTLNPNWGAEDGVPDTVMFRFKTNGLPTSNIPYSQSLWKKSVLSSDNGSHLLLRYTGSAYNSASYSGSIIDPQYQYAHLDFYPDYNSQPNVSCSVYLPFFDEGWWSVMVNRSSSVFTLTAANKTYDEGNNGTQIGFISSSTKTGDNSEWTDSGISTFASSSILGPNTYQSFSGSLQEIKYYTIPISESVFKDYTMNPHSIEGNSINSSPNELIFRASLGGELYTGSTSIHPKITGSWVTTQSFASDSSFNFNSTPTFVPNIETFFADQPIAGIKNIISDKIRIENDVIPSGNTLSSFTSLTQTTNISQSYTPNINYLEVAFSPQNEINEDIVNQIGYFNIGDYIGDPRLRSSSATSYPDLDDLRNDYFEKYIKNYNLKDFVRLIKFFDNSLFKMIKDFIPARTSLASGVVIKQHLLERNKYPQPQLSFTNTELSGTLKPQWNEYEEGRIVNTVGGTGGMFEPFNSLTTSPSGSLGNGPNNRYGITQSWSETIPTLSGSIVKTYTNQDEFYDGIFNGTILVVTTQSINFPLPIGNQSSEYNQVHYYGNSTRESSIFENNFLNTVTIPQDGEILFYHDDFLPAISDIWSTKYLKISKNDCNGVDNSIILENATKAYIFIPAYNTYVLYNIELLNEQSNYYLYGLTQSQLYAPAFWPNQVLDYFVSASSINNFGLIPIDVPIVKYSTVVGNTLGYFSQNPGSYTLEDTPNTSLIISSSFTFTVTGNLTASISRLENGSFTSISSTTGTAPGTFLVDAISYPLNGDQLYLTVKGDSSATFNNGSILVTQSRAVSSSLCYPVLFEPYITTTNFYNSDDNALINNIDTSVLSETYQNVDYSTNILTPTNFNQLISGNATKAPVQDSNYSSKAYTGVRYDGSKSTSKLLNTWSPGDKGTYGKLPTIESDKVYVAYGDMEGGWPPERMNASSFGIRYLISQDGDVVIPNVSENSLYITQGTFQTGERFRVSSKTEGFGDPEWEYRDIIRGGNTIQPILYTQIGKQPGALWTSSIELIDIQTTSGSATSNYQNNGSLSEKPDYQLRDRFSLTPGTTNNNLIQSATYSVTGNDYNFYQTPIGAVNEAITLNIQITNLQAKFRQFGPDNGIPFTYGPAHEGVFGVILKIKTNGNESTYAVSQQELPPGSFTAQIYDSVQGQTGQLLNLDNVNFTIPPGVLQENSEVSIEYVMDTIDFFASLKVKIIGGSYSITQIPVPTELITVGTNNIWGYYDKTNYPYIITSSNDVSSSLGALYGDPNVKQEDIPGSGFNPITFPWSIEYGDEFRFEGDERFSYTVGPVFGPNETVFTYPYKKITQQRLSPTGSIEVHFNSNLPVSASIDSFNLDHFLIRRYTDDASRIIFEGFKPPGSEGPYILIPEYASDKLNKSVDEYISDLTQKGLL